MSTKMLIIAEIFSPWANGRTFGKDGQETGDKFRDDYLIPALKDSGLEKITVSLKGLNGLGSSFKEEAFGGLLRSGNGFTLAKLKQKLQLETDFSPEINEIWGYIQDEEKKQINGKE